MSKNSKNNKVDKGAEIIKPYSVIPLAHQYRFYVSGVIEKCEHYSLWFDTIKNASPNDLIYVNINSYGGDMFTAIQLYSCLKETEAHVVIEIEGACYSAATMLMLAGSEVTISPFASFMFHDYSSGVIGKGSEMVSRIRHERMLTENMYRKIYRNFLKDEEIEKMLEGADLWFDMDEVKDRFVTFYEALAKEEENAEVEVEETPEPTTTKKKNKKKND